MFTASQCLSRCILLCVLLCLCATLISTQSWYQPHYPHHSFDADQIIIPPGCEYSNLSSCFQPESFFFPDFVFPSNHQEVIDFCNLKISGYKCNINYVQRCLRSTPEAIRQLVEVMRTELRMMRMVRDDPVKRQQTFLTPAPCWRSSKKIFNQAHRRYVSIMEVASALTRGLNKKAGCCASLYLFDQVFDYFEQCDAMVALGYHM
mgnify:CR=1 FL=1